jgi:type II secretory pathway predicted ATPase ExeA
MLVDVMDHFGFARDLRAAGYFQTEHHQQLLRELEAAIRRGGLIALAGIVGCGKTTLLWQLQDRLKKAGTFHVAESLAVDVNRVNLNNPEAGVVLRSGNREGWRPAQQAGEEQTGTDQAHPALCVDDAHDLNGNTLRGLKRIIERVHRRRVRLSILLAGHPKLRNDLRRPTLEEIGARATVFRLEGLKGQQKAYLDWLLEQSMKPKTKPEEILTEEALALLTERLVTPLQIEHYVTRALEQAHRLGEKPVTAEIVEAVMAPDINALEPMLIRHGYTARALTELLNVRPAEVRALLHGQLPEERADELKQQLLMTVIPL